MFALVLCLLFASGCAASARHMAAEQNASIGGPRRESRFVRRNFSPTLKGRWIGNAIAYGPYRDGQSPGGVQPSRDQIAEDLQLMAHHWNLIRLYGALGPAETVLSVIREERLPVRVMLGAWIGTEDRRDSTGAVIETLSGARESNRREVDSAVRLANEYRDIVVAISAGNETQVNWSDHRIPAEMLIRFIQDIRSRTRVPVTTADDYNFWNKPESHVVADEIDFIVMHAHPLWNGKQLDEALGWTTATWATIRASHPTHTVVLGETGWATRRHDEGEQARLIKGAAGEAEQKIFHQAVTHWARETRTTTFFF